MSIKIAAVVAGLAGVATGQNLLGNSGFESPILFDVSAAANPGQWVAFFGGPPGTFLQSFNDTGTAPFEGNNALLTTIAPALGSSTDARNAFTGQQQFVQGIIAGGLYEFSIYARNNGSTLNGGAEFRIEWTDANGNVLDIDGDGAVGFDPDDVFLLNTDITGQLTDEYQLFTLSGIAPAGAAGLNAVFAIQTFAGSGIADISVAFDAASVTLVPAPGAFAALGAAGLLAGRRRRA